MAETLHEERNRLDKESRAIIDKAKEDGGRAMTEEEVTAWNTNNTRIDELDAKIEAQDQTANIEAAQAAREKRLDAVPDRRTPHIMPGEAYGGQGHEVPSGTPIQPGKQMLIDHPQAGYEGPAGFGEMALDIHAARVSSCVAPRLADWHNAVKAAAGDGVSTLASEGGSYLLPTTFGNLIHTISLESAVVRPRATVIPVTSLRTSFPGVDDTTHASTVFGGIQAYFESEEAQITSSKPKFRNINLDLYRLAALAYVTNTMLDWSPISMSAWLPDKLAQAIAWKEDQKFISGSKAGEPVGVLNTAGVIEVSAEDDQDATSLEYMNVVKMDARCWQAGGPGKTVIIANRTCKPEIATMHLTHGISGTAVFAPSTGQPGSALYDYPVLYTEHAKALGTAGDFMICNLGEYVIGDASSKMRTDRSFGLKFDYDQTAFRVVTYVGGICPWRVAFTPENGDTLHPMVKLAARA